MLWTLNEFRAYLCVNLGLTGASLTAVDWVISHCYIKWLFERITKEFDQAKKHYSVTHIDSGAKYGVKYLGIHPIDPYKSNYHFYIRTEKKSSSIDSCIYFSRLPLLIPGIVNYVQDYALESPLNCYRVLTKKERFEDDDHGILPKTLKCDESFLLSIVNGLIVDGV